MNIDWLIAIVVFLGFVTWAFGYYMTFFNVGGTSLEDMAYDISDKVLDFLTIDVYEVPIKVDSSQNISGQVLYFSFTWPDDTKNSTRIVSGIMSFGCNITGNTVYWSPDLEEGENYFFMRFKNQSMDLFCVDDTVNITDENRTQVIPWVMERKKLVSQERIDEMNSTDYFTFKNIIGVSRDFRIEIENGLNMSYGLSVPEFSNVYVKETWNKIEEYDKKIKIRVLVW